MTIAVSPEKATLTKRGTLAKLAKVYDPLGLISPVTLSGKLIYRKVCETKRAWDAEIPTELAKSVIVGQVGEQITAKH